MRVRFAPTPSGYLHEGTCANALLVSWLASGSGAIVLRIDDIDGPRYRREYADDVFASLGWLGVRLDEGPRSSLELESTFSQRLRIDRYRDALGVAVTSGRVYACACPRGALTCTCPEADLAHRPGITTLRLLSQGGQGPGAVVWRRDDIPAYHLTSVVDDHDLGITHVVRGEDLRESTRIQAALADALGLAFPADVRHHPLALGPDGAKLSKSTGTAGPLAHDTGTRQRVQDLAERWAPSVMITAPTRTS